MSAGFLADSLGLAGTIYATSPKIHSILKRMVVEGVVVNNNGYFRLYKEAE
jgi:hypothetical protein